MRPSRVPSSLPLAAKRLSNFQMLRFPQYSYLSTVAIVAIRIAERCLEFPLWLAVHFRTNVKSLAAANFDLGIEVQGTLPNAASGRFRFASASIRTKLASIEVTATGV